MKRHLLLLMICFVILGCGRKISSPNTKISNEQILLNQIVEYTKENSLYRQNVDWDTLSLKINQRADGAKSISDLSIALKFMLESIGDEHGQIIHNNNVIANYFGPVKEHQKEIKPEIYNNIQIVQTYKFYSELLENNTGYLRIVSLPMGDNEQMAKEIQDQVCQLITNGAKNWVLDLRYNGGGNLLPMVEGLTSIIGDGNVGGAKGLTTEQDNSWTIENGDFFLDNYSIELENDCSTNNKPSVAVLLSEYTASSGEALAIVLKGRKNTRFFGKKTFGQVTGNFYEFLNDSITVNIAINYYKDRNNTIYKEYVDVDHTVDFVIDPLSGDDSAIELAQDWFRSMRKGN